MFNDVTWATTVGYSKFLAFFRSRKLAFVLGDYINKVQVVKGVIVELNGQC